MKNLSLFRVLFLALAVFAISSCGEDDGTDPSTTLPPTITFLDGVDVITTDTTLAAGETFTVNISAAKGDNELLSLTIYEDDVQVDFSRITFAHTDPANNPQTVGDANVDALDWTITIVAHDDERVATYDFEITDKAQNRANAVLDVNTVPDVAPTVFEVNHSVSMGCFTVNTTVEAGSSFCLSVDATKGDFDLATVTVYENNDIVDVSRLDWAENPYTLVGDEVTSFMNLAAQITAHSSAGTSEYRMVVTDANGEEMEAGVFVSVGTLIDDVIVGALLNAAGPVNTGGCDLNTGNENVGSNDPLADIKDEGIDTSLPLDQNWKQQISGTNGSEIRSANNLQEGFKFDNIALKEEIIAAFDNSDPITTTNAIDLVSNPDYNQFVVRNAAGEYFFIKITNVNKTIDNNDDSYTLSIKQ